MNNNILFRTLNNRLFKNKTYVYVLCFVCFVFYSQTLLAQGVGHPIKRVSIYYKPNQYELNIFYKEVIDSLLFDDQESLYPINIRINGNCDNTGDSLYNYLLSVKRTDEIANFIKSIGISNSIIHCNYYGENQPIFNNNDSIGKQNNRRVDLYIQYEYRDVRINCTDCNYLLCAHDTVLILKNGVKIKMNQCLYYSLKNCLEFEVYTSMNDILQNEISLSDVNQHVIASCGMIHIKLKPGCSEKNCFDVPIQVLFPIPDNTKCDLCKRNARLFTLNSSGNWATSPSSKNKARIVKDNNQTYYQLSVYCFNTFSNCDCHLDSNKFTIRLPLKYRFSHLQLYSECPLINYYPAINSNKNRVKVMLPCIHGVYNMKATCTDKNNQSYDIKSIQLNDLHKNVLLSKCKKEPEQYLRIRPFNMRIPYRSLYRSYHIKKRNLTQIMKG